MASAPQVETAHTAPARPLLVRALIVLALVFVAAMTLVPTPGGSATATPLCLVCGDRGGTDLILNVLLFVPLGAGLALRGVPMRRAVLTGVAVSALVELLQLTLVAGRDPTIGDVVNNGAGTLLGALLARSWRAWLAPAPRPASRLATAGALAWLGIMLLSAHAVRPAPTDADYFGQLRPDRPRQWDRFEGDVLSAQAGGVALMEGRMRPRQATALRRTFDLAARIDPPTDAPPRLAPIVAVFDGRREEIGLLAQRGDALLFRSRTGAASLRLTAPELAVPGIFQVKDRPGCAREGTPVDVRARAEPGAMIVEVGGDCGVRRVARTRVSDGWMLLMPFRWEHGPLTDPLRMAWLAGLVGAWSYWAALAALPRRRATVALATTAIVLAAALLPVPLAAGLPTGTWWEWLAAVAGSAAGWTAARARLRHA